MKQADPHRHSHTMRFFQFFIVLAVAPDHSHATHHIVDDKIPVIRPVKHTDQKSKHQHVGICQSCHYLVFIKIPVSCHLRLQRIFSAVMLHHRINQTDQCHHKHQIDHMGM